MLNYRHAETAQHCLKQQNTKEGVKQKAWEGKSQGLKPQGLATAYSLGGLSLPLEMCCVGVTVETGNREKHSHHVHNKPCPAEGP